ncbi:MAG: hypothetical protein QIT35_gp73 [Methanophagales virus PBV299]|uniref:Uncharacterized protein n=1 Tax=Methanophagales virus PBV299 TaxID=2987730 RepID=A0ABY6GLH8_9CAUD|nr:MAG: hypothetical protein QIT35_gp73 [Methanophagales virus PBV299]UYL64869.1 MAG: hypothetical protein OFDIEDLO_00073 [Methanophagales virus PBV299]
MPDQLRRTPCNKQHERRPRLNIKWVMTMWKLRISQEKRIYKKARELQKRLESEIQTISVSHLKQKLGKRLMITEENDRTKVILRILTYEGNKTIDLEEEVFDWRSGERIGVAIPYATDQMRLLRRLDKILKKGI